MNEFSHTLYFFRKPVHAKSGDPMRVSLTLDFEDNTAGNGNFFMLYQYIEYRLDFALLLLALFIIV